MSKATYIAAICGEAGRYGVVFPDFMGCVSAGATIEEVKAMAEEALQLHIEGMIEEGETLPEPTRPTLDDVVAVYAEEDGTPIEETWVGLIDVTVDVPAFVETVPVRVKADLVERIAALAAATSSQIDSRRFIEEAVEHEIERYRKSAA